jgi:translation initiation factor 4E
MQSNQPPKLNSEWTFWYASRKEKDHHIPYENRLTEISTFSDLRSFLQTYIYLKNVKDIPRNADISLFKKGYLPLWENCPDSGYWFHRFNEEEEKDVNYQWEKIVFALIGEQFNEANILGAVLSIRGRETIIQLWFNYFSYDQIKDGLSEKFKKILGIEKPMIFFKDNKQSMQDKSSLRNAERYNYKRGRKYTYN